MSCPKCCNERFPIRSLGGVASRLSAILLYAGPKNASGSVSLESYSATFQEDVTTSFGTFTLNYSINVDGGGVSVTDQLKSAVILRFLGQQSGGDLRSLQEGPYVEPVSTPVTGTYTADVLVPTRDAFNQVTGYVVTPTQWDVEASITGNGSFGVDPLNHPHTSTEFAFVFSVLAVMSITSSTLSSGPSTPVATSLFDIFDSTPKEKTEQTKGFTSFTRGALDTFSDFGIYAKLNRTE